MNHPFISEMVGWNVQFISKFGLDFFLFSDFSWIIVRSLGFRVNGVISENPKLPLPARYHLSYHGRALAFSSTTLQLLCGPKLAGEGPRKKKRIAVSHDQKNP